MLIEAYVFDLFLRDNQIDQISDIIMY